MIKLLYGNEPFLIDCNKNKATDKVIYKDLNLAFFNSFNQEVLRLALTHPFMEDQRVIVLNIDNLKELDNKDFLQYFDKPSKSTELIIICRKPDERLKIFKRLQENSICCNKVKTKKEFQDIILRLLNRYSARITEEAMIEFQNRINYFEIEEMNILQASGYILNIAAVTKEIGINDIKQFVPEFSNSDNKQITTLIKNKETSKLLKLLENLPTEDAIGNLSFLLYSFRVSLKLKYLDASEIATRGFFAFKELETDTLKKCIKVIDNNIYGIKQGTMPAELALKNACISVMSIIYD